MATLDPVPADRPSNSEEALLVARARAGEIGAIEEIVRGHQAWIYNLAVRMLQHPFDAEDATQEILVKALTRLSSFEGRSSFRTWLYRLAVNHVLNTKRGRRERETVTFQCYGHGLDATPDLDPPDEGSAPADVRLLVDEARLRCTSGMLLCLDREQRVIYILGEIFGLTDGVGAELLDISRDTFRQRLARARRDLHSFMNDKCGLVNPPIPAGAPARPVVSSRRATWIRETSSSPGRTCGRSARSSGPGPRRCRRSTGSAARSTGSTRSPSRWTWCRR